MIICTAFFKEDPNHSMHKSATVFVSFCGQLIEEKMIKVSEPFYALSFAHDLSGVKNPSFSRAFNKEGAQGCTVQPVSKENQFLRDLCRR